MKTHYSKMIVAIVAVMTIGAVGCTANSNPVSSGSTDGVQNFMVAKAGDAQSPMVETTTKPDGKVPIYALAQKAGLKTLAKAIQAAKLQQTLTVDGPFTVFAPTEEAFAALPEGTLESLLDDPEALKDILLYHVVSGEVKAAEVVGLSEATMLNGKTVSISTDGGVMVNDANVIKTDIMAKNGVVHLIDKVLIP